MPETLTATTHVSVTRLASRVGAEIAGADADTPLSDEAIAKIRQALLDHTVVFLRGQSRVAANTPLTCPLVGNADPAQRTCGNAPCRDMPRFRSRDAAVPQPEVTSARDTGTGFLNRSSTGQCSSTAAASWA